jgi:hypothetical protein
MNPLAEPEVMKKTYTSNYIKIIDPDITFTINAMPKNHSLK